MLIAAAALALPAHAFNAKRLESVQKRAAADNKLIAFVVLQDYYDPNCPKCITSVDANNSQIKRIAPNKGVIVIKLEKDDLKDEGVPSIVLKGPTPRLVITDAACTKVIDSLGAKSDKARVKEMEAKVAAALGAKA